MTTIYTYVCTRCCAGWTISSNILRSKQRCHNCGRYDRVELRGQYEKISLSSAEAVPLPAQEEPPGSLP
jgi:hypothetical protein